VTLEDKLHAQRLRLFRRAEELGNVSAACREAGVARSLYYQLRDRYRKHGPAGLHPKHRQGRPGRPPALDAQVERRILAEALAQPAWGPQRIADQLALRGIEVAPSTVYRALRRHRLGTRMPAAGGPPFQARPGRQSLRTGLKAHLLPPGSKAQLARPHARTRRGSRQRCSCSSQPGCDEAKPSGPSGPTSTSTAAF